MSVILEFGVAGEEFTLGEMLSGLPPMQIEPERVVPTGDGVMPFLWVSPGDREAFEETVSAHRTVDDVVALGTADGHSLYRLEWRGEEDDLIRAIADADGALLEAYGDDEWEFRLRLPDHDSLSAFHESCLDRGISIRVDRTYASTGRAKSGRRYDLSPAQREALLLALREGYFETPSEANLSDLAEELGISQQALSSRIRRGTRNVLGNALLSQTPGFD